MSVLAFVMIASASVTNVTSNKYIISNRLMQYRTINTIITKIDYK